MELWFCNLSFVNSVKADEGWINRKLSSIVHGGTHQWHVTWSFSSPLIVQSINTAVSITVEHITGLQQGVIHVSSLHILGLFCTPKVENITSLCYALSFFEGSNIDIGAVCLPTLCRPRWRCLCVLSAGRAKRATFLPQPFFWAALWGAVRVDWVRSLLTSPPPVPVGRPKGLPGDGFMAGKGLWPLTLRSPHLSSL